MFRSIVSRLGVRLYARMWSSASRGVLATAAGPMPAPLPPMCTPFHSHNQIRLMHDLSTKGDQELMTFLNEEIATEKKSQRSSSVPKAFEGFTVQGEKAKLTLTKKFNEQETVEIKLNVNHTVDSESGANEGDIGPPSHKMSHPTPGSDPNEADMGEMRSRPNFEVSIKKGKDCLVFNCSFVRNMEPAANPDDYNDSYVIDELSLYEGEWEEEVYAVAGDILDGYLYDLFMNMLEERGITNDFVEKLSDLSTDYEHHLYVDMLSRLQRFVSNK